MGNTMYKPNANQSGLYLCGRFQTDAPVYFTLHCNSRSSILRPSAFAKVTPVNLIFKTIQED